MEKSNQEVVMVRVNSQDPNVFKIKSRLRHKRDNGEDIECTCAWVNHWFQQRISLYNRVQVLFTDDKRWLADILKSLYVEPKFLEIEITDQVISDGPKSDMIVNRIIFTRKSHNWDNALPY